MKDIRHTGIVVSNLERSLNFYQSLLGFKVVKKQEESGKYIEKISALKKARVVTVKMAAQDGNLIELLYYPNQPALSKTKRLNEIGVSHLAFTVEDIDKEYKRLSAKGVRFNSSPQVSPDGYAKVVFCQDPDGLFLELVQVLEKKKEGMPNVSEIAK